MRICISFLIGLSILAFEEKAQAWGERGHHDICYVATRLVKDPQLKQFLITRGHMMGHVCNIPDIYWRDIPNTYIGNATHFMEPDLFNISMANTPTILADYVAMLNAAPPSTPNETIGDKLNKVGTSWWRAEQFANLAIAAGKLAATSTPPTTSVDQQNWNLPYNNAVYNMITNMGLMGHFAGDTSMPRHNWADYDGYATGHGGVHYFYETECVSTYGLKLAYQVEQAARKFQLKPFNTFPEGMKQVSILSVQEVSAMDKLDKVITPSTTKTNLGMTINTPAVRQPDKIACPKFLPLIIPQMARSAKLIAAFWDKIYADAGRPNLTPYQSYEYPLEPPFVTPDYLSPYMPVN